MHWKAQSLLRDINIAVQNVREREQDARVREHTIQELNQFVHSLLCLLLLIYNTPLD